MATGSSPQSWGSRISIIRPSDTTTYGVNDVVGVTGGGTGCITFPNMAPGGGGEVLITAVTLQRNASALIASEAAYWINWFNIAMPSALADNIAFDVAAADQASYLGTTVIGTPVDLGSTLFIAAAPNLHVSLISSSLFGVLTTQGNYQPVSAAVHVVTVHTRLPV